LSSYFLQTEWTRSKVNKVAELGICLAQVVEGDPNCGTDVQLHATRLLNYLNMKNVKLVKPYEEGEALKYASVLPSG
jgi:hypothetical protein